MNMTDEDRIFCAMLFAIDAIENIITSNNDDYSIKLKWSKFSGGFEAGQSLISFVGMMATPLFIEGFLAKNIKNAEIVRRIKMVRDPGIPEPILIACECIINEVDAEALTNQDIAPEYLNATKMTYRRLKNAIDQTS